ncbi:GTPase domain-containing protein [Mesorhizobium sp. M0494]|uniref:GTPase domain-containing protein n=1 Tax=Mesorhizobium sp. M0494 TaxID=2956951 RepID=UPI00333D9BAA
MVEARYTAAKVRAKEGATWVLTFRHPLKPDPRGKLGRKMRRSACTTDEVRAEKLVQQLNALLSDESWFTTERQADATAVFDEVVVRAFYDDLTTPTARSFDVRGQKISLPHKDEGYCRTLLIGPTGVGKTSLLRQLIGSHPDRDRFPSTSASRTTISDIEVITAPSEIFDCVATFFNEWTVQTLVHECVADACAILWDDQPDAKVAERLLHHRDMRFRLSYILGAWGHDLAAAIVEEDGFDDAPPPFDDDGEDIPAANEMAEMQAILKSYVMRIRSLASKAKAELAVEVESLAKEDRDAAQDLFEEGVQTQADFDELVADIMDEIRKRFDRLGPDLVRRPGGWPESWFFTSNDRDEFIRTIRRLSSNWAPSFGTLLTPLVDGIRIRGPFAPSFGGEAKKLVLLDGEGLGHAKDSAAAVTSHITSRFAEVDVILLVDTAKAPMLDGPTSILRAVAASGHHDKLAIAFTSCDLIKRQANLPTQADQRAHVMATVDQPLASLREVVGAPVVRAITRDLDERCFMLGYLDRRITEKNPAPAGELLRLLDHLERTGLANAAPVQVKPVYELARLLFSIQGAVAEFHARWNAILRMGGAQNVRCAHWAEVKALNRRVALRIGNYEYSPASLMPVADLVGRMAEWITRHLDTPLRWEGKQPTDEEAEAALGLVQREVYKRLTPFAHQRLIEMSHARWTRAFHLSGRGSTFDRARTVQTIYMENVPVPGPVLDHRSIDLLREMQTLVGEAIEAADGTLIGEALG